MSFCGFLPLLPFFESIHHARHIEHNQEISALSMDTPPSPFPFRFLTTSWLTFNSHLFSSNDICAGEWLLSRRVPTQMCNEHVRIINISTRTHTPLWGIERQPERDCIRTVIKYKLNL